MTHIEVNLWRLEHLNLKLFLVCKELEEKKKPTWNATEPVLYILLNPWTAPHYFWMCCHLILSLPRIISSLQTCTFMTVKFFWIFSWDRMVIYGTDPSRNGVDLNTLIHMQNLNCQQYSTNFIITVTMLV